MPYSTLDAARFLYRYQRSDARRYLFDEQKSERYHHIREAEYEAEKHRRLRQFVGNGVYYLAKVAHHVEFACDKAVYYVRKPRKQQHEKRPIIALFADIQPDYDRYQAKSEQGQ